MANKLYEESYIQDIADAIRTKNGTQNKYKVSQMGDAIRAIEGSGSQDTEQEPEYELGNLIKSGVCGDSATYEFYDDGTLIINGTGVIYENEIRPNVLPWTFWQEDTSFCLSIKRAIINEGITESSGHLFCLCENLKEVILPNGFTKINISDFSSCESLEKINIPNTVTCIGETAFDSCYNLEYIIIPDSVTKIEYGAFEFCTSLKELHIPDTVTSIGEMAFWRCDSLTDIKLSNTLTSIEPYLFSGCESLQQIDIPDTVTHIGHRAFENCIKLRNIVFPTGMTSIEDGVFTNCFELHSFVIPDTVTSVGICAFSGCYNLQSINLPDGLKTIGGGAFEYCESITSIIIPNSVEILGEAILYGCTNLESVSFGDGLTEVPAWTASNCFSIKSVIIPTSIQCIGECAFIEEYYDSDLDDWVETPLDLESVFYKGTKEEWDNIIIGENNESLFNATLYCEYEGTNTPNIGGVDTSQDTVTEETLGENVTAHNKYGIQITGKFPISEVDTQANLIEQIQTAIQNKTSLNNQVFFELLTGDIVEFTIPTSITTIRDGMFYGCANLKTITIPEGVTSIGRSAFYLCDGLEKIKIPSTVTSISTYAFGACGNILEYDFSDWVSIPTLDNTNAFQGINSNCKMKVPSNLLNSLKTASGWSTYKNYMVAV